MSNVHWKGIYPAVLTPFKADDSIDYDMFKINTDAQLEAGVDGIILSGSLGEASTLTSREKIDLLIYAKEITQDKVPVIMNIAEQSTKSAIQHARDAEDNGADGLMLLPPMRYKADERETIEFFSTIAKSTSLPVMIYNNPFDYKIEVTLDMFSQLADLPNVQAIKESTRDITNITRTINRFGNRFSILGGVDTLSYESLCSGADGLVAGLVDAFPRETVAIFRLVKAGQFQEARKIYRWFMPLLELDIHPKLVQYIKLAAMQTGIGSEHVRAPRLALAGKERETVLAIINKAIANRPELPDYLNLLSEEKVQWA
ncbi:MAG: dihydrodipicolinate synthase family protein [Chitinophagaceae bacterium]